METFVVPNLYGSELYGLELIWFRTYMVSNFMASDLYGSELIRTFSVPNFMVRNSYGPELLWLVNEFTNGLMHELMHESADPGLAAAL